MRIAINGCGVAGPTLAWWLRHYGHVPVLFEKAPELRRGGYVIDFWGAGYQVADKMGLLPALRRDGYIMERLKTVTSGGHATSSIDVSVFRELTHDQYLSIARSNLARSIHEACDGVETRFGTSVTGVDDQGGHVRVRQSDGREEDFDLLVGADGLHSHVRDLVFGSQQRFEKKLGYHVAAFTVPGYRPRDELTYMSHTRPGRQISRVALRDDKTLFLFVFAAHLIDREPVDEFEQKAMLHQVFDDIGWEAPAILACMDDASDLYFDRVSQIRMPQWTRGRVALLGDAAACASLLAGEGTGLAMTEAYILAGELHRAGGDHGAAFAAYERQLKPYLETKQDMALRFAGFFAPTNWFWLIMRDVMANFAAIPYVAKLILGPSFRTDVDLPDYR